MFACKVKREIVTRSIRLFERSLVGLISLFFFSCGSGTHTQIERRAVVSPTIAETLRAVVHPPAERAGDTVIVGMTTDRKDTVTLVKYFPQREKFYVYVKPDTVFFADTVIIIEQVIVETSFIAKFGLVMLGIVIGAFMIGVGYALRIGR